MTGLLAARARSAGEDGLPEGRFGAAAAAFAGSATDCSATDCWAPHALHAVARHWISAPQRFPGLTPCSGLCGGGPRMALRSRRIENPERELKANLFVDWSAPFHTPPWQACNGLPIEAGQSTVLDLMGVAPDGCSPGIASTIEGSGQSAYLTAIDGVESNANGNGYYWVYFVNGAMPPVGIGSCVLQDGDSVAWDYKHYSSGLKQANDPTHPLAE